MPAITEANNTAPAAPMDESTASENTDMLADDLDDMLDEALDDNDDSYSTQDTSVTSRKRTASPSASTVSWEYAARETPKMAKTSESHDFKTPLVAGKAADSPSRGLPEVEGEEGHKLLHTVSFYRKQQGGSGSGATPSRRIVRNVDVIAEEPQAQVRNISTLCVRFKDGWAINNNFSNLGRLSIVSA